MRHDTIAYRPDIDGLRAVAIVSVVAYHAAPQWLPGGYVGVDIFFVISGYLISSILFREMDRGEFTLARFYARRIRRLFPALTLVLAVTGIAGWFYLLPHELRALGGEIAAGAAYVINFTLERQAGYFDTAAGQKPLLHLWSLAIEEQFYIVYPALLLILRRAPRLWTFGFLVAATIASAVFCIVETPKNEAAAFYLPQSRLWELSAGALFAFVEIYAAERARALSAFAWAGLPQICSLSAFAGLALVAGAAIGFGAAVVYPGAWALIPCLGALLLIGGGAESFVNRWLLANPIAVGIGLISYPVYLWHWPLLSFIKILGIDGNWRIRLGAVAVAVVLGALTYLAIERPLRRAPGRLLAAGLFAAMWAISFFGVLLYWSVVEPRLNDRTFKEISAAYTDFEYPDGMREERSPSGQKLRLAGAGQPSTLYLGDSNIEQYWPRVETLLARNSHLGTVVFATAGGCPPIPEVNLDHTARCANYDRMGVDLALHRGFSNVVIGANWQGYFAYGGYFVAGEGQQLSNGNPASERAFANLLRMIQSFRDRGLKVSIILNIPTGWQLSPLAGLRRSWTGAANIVETRLDRLAFDASWSWARAKLIEIAEKTGSSIIDPMETLCDSTTCPSKTSDGRFIYKDDHHLRSAFVREHATFIDGTLASEPAPAAPN